MNCFLQHNVAKKKKSAHRRVSLSRQIHTRRLLPLYYDRRPPWKISFCIAVLDGFLFVHERFDHHSAILSGLPPVILRIMRLSDISTIAPSTLSALQKANLHTATQLLSLPSIELSRVTSLPTATIQATLQKIYSATAARAQPAKLSTAPPLETGLDSLDTALNGGLQPHRVTQLVGPPLSGKTQLALSVTATTLAADKSVLWLSSSTSSHALTTRLRAILRARNHAPDAVSRALSNLLILPASTHAKALHVIHTLRRDITLLVTISAPSEKQPGLQALLRDPRLVVFDSPTACLSPLLGLRAHDGWTGHVALVEVATALRWFAVRTDAAVLITNRVVRSEREAPPFGSLRPALGNAWASFVDVSVMLERDDELDALRFRTVSKSAPDGCGGFSLGRSGAVNRMKGEEMLMRTLS